VLQIDDLRGHLQSVEGGSPGFDDINSYRVDVDYARIAISGASLTNLLNNFTFSGEDAPIRKITATIAGGELTQSGPLKKSISLPVKMRATGSAAADGRLQVHPTSLKAAGFVSKRVLDFFGLDLQSLVSTERTPGVAIVKDDLLLDPERALPPPRVRGRLTRAWIEGDRLWLQFGDPRARGLESPLPRVANYIYYRGGVLRFGKLTMNDADLLLMDDDPRDPFDFSPARYNDQLVAGYSKNTARKGLVVHMPDANDLKDGRRTR
jgi:hypothetical protein